MWKTGGEKGRNERRRRRGNQRESIQGRLINAPGGIVDEVRRKQDRKRKDLDVVSLALGVGAEALEKKKVNTQSPQGLMKLTSVSSRRTAVSLGNEGCTFVGSTSHIQIPWVQGSARGERRR